MAWYRETAYRQIVEVWYKKASSSRNKRLVGFQQRKLLAQPG